MIVDGRGPVIDSEFYTVALKVFISEGGDGFKFFSENESEPEFHTSYMIKEESAALVKDIIYKFFETIDTNKD